ncbi:MAG: YggT family protein [Pyrinomonadaceae bacterium]
MLILKTLYLFITWGVMAVAIAAIALIILRSIYNYADVNPFRRSAISLKRATDPMILPIRRLLIAFRLEPKVAPFIAVLLIILIGYFVVQVASSVLNTIAGILYAVTSGVPGFPIAIVGYLVFGLLGLYTLAIFVRIFLSYGGLGYGNRWMRFLIRITEPLMAPLRRNIRPIGMFDISPIIAFLILWVLQAIVAATLLKGWPVQFF